MLRRATNYYDDLFIRSSGEGIAPRVAVERAATAYLDGKPQRVGGKKLTRKERDALFWASDVVQRCGPDAWSGEAISLALARYLGQEPVAADGLVSRVAREAPDALIRAVRRAGLVLRPRSARRVELEAAAADSEAVAEICRVLDLFAGAHAERVAILEAQRARLAGLSAFEFLLYASLYAFEVLVPRDFSVKTPVPPAGADVEGAWAAIGDLLAWKLAGASAPSLRLTEGEIGKALARHLRPILFESGTPSAGEALQNLRAFHAVMDAQVELSEFIAGSADAFSYDDGIRFERRGNRLEIVEVDPAAGAAWQREGLKLDRLHGYWFHRALETYVEQVAADRAKWTIGRPENAEANRLAWLRALQAQLRLREAYGVADEVTSDSGDAVDLFRALLSLNLMSVHFQQDFLAAFAERLDASGDWVAALQRLVFDGLREGLQNRMPLTWSSRDSKVSNITGWTVTASEPAGNPRQASAILDFWTYDMAAMAERLQRDGPALQPDLHERPILRFGATLVQLPWVVGVQNNSTAAINNLRRLGARRGQARDEARRIEAGLAHLLEQRGFKTALNWMPPSEAADVGEVDLIAYRDGHLFVIEVKSTFLRRSRQEAWRHAATALRTAGEQLRRKLPCVLLGIVADAGLRAALGVAGEEAPLQPHGWIADTSIECDHQRFSGFLKVSVEELLIALRDDRHLLRDPAEFLATDRSVGGSADPEARDTRRTLYPDGFTAGRFVEVVEGEAVWASV